MARKKKVKAPPEPLPKDFLDQIAPAVVKFNTDHYILALHLDTEFKEIASSA